MNKIILASVAFLGLAGAAVAQEAPAFYGVNPYAATVDAQDANRASVHTVSGQANASLVTTDGFNINQNENYSGK